MKLILRALAITTVLASLAACGYDSGWGHMDPIKTGGDGKGDIAN